MKFVQWLFSVGDRHYGDAVRYDRGGKGTRIFAIIMLVAFVALTLLLEWWAVNLFNENAIYGILVFVLVLGAIEVTIEYCIVYSVYGFTYAIAGTVGDIIKKRELKRLDKGKKINKERCANVESGDNELSANKDVDVSSESTDNSMQVEVNENKMKKELRKMSPKWLDLVVGVLGALLAVGTIAGVIIILSLNA